VQTASHDRDRQYSARAFAYSATLHGDKGLAALPRVQHSNLVEPSEISEAAPITRVADRSLEGLSGR